MKTLSGLVVKLAVFVMIMVSAVQAETLKITSNFKQTIKITNCSSDKKVGRDVFLLKKDGSFFSDHGKTVGTYLRLNSRKYVLTYPDGIFDYLASWANKQCEANDVQITSHSAPLMSIKLNKNRTAAKLAAKLAMKGYSPSYNIRGNLVTVYDGEGAVKVSR